MAAAGNSRARNLTRKFILLRWIDPLRVQSTRNLDTLERSGRVKDITFLNNLSTAGLTELLVHAFGQHLVAGDMQR